jgi:hypothetical protein
LSLKPTAVLGFDGVLIGEAHNASMLMDSHSQSVDLLAQRGVSARIVDDFAHPLQQSRIIERRLAYADAILTQLPGLANQPGGMGQGAHRNGSVVGCHAAKICASDERRARAEVRSPQRRKHSCGSGADDDDVRHPSLSSDRKLIRFSSTTPDSRAP